MALRAMGGHRSLPYERRLVGGTENSNAHSRRRRTLKRIWASAIIHRAEPMLWRTWVPSPRSLLFGAAPWRRLERNRNRSHHERHQVFHKEVRGMKSDFYTAIAQIAAERGIPREAVLSSVEHALKTVYKKMANTEEEVDVNIDPNTGSMHVYVIKNVVEEIEDPLNDILPAEARKITTDAMVGDQIRIERTPDNFGRIAAQTAKQVVLQKIRDYERDSVYEEFADRQGEVLNGIVQRADSRAVIVELGKAEAVMPVREQVPTERYRPGQRVKVLLVEVNRDQRGPQLIVSRSHPNLIRRLFEME